MLKDNKKGTGGKGIHSFLFHLTEAKASGSAVEKEEQPLP